MSAARYNVIVEQQSAIWIQTRPAPHLSATPFSWSLRYRRLFREEGRESRIRVIQRLI